MTKIEMLLSISLPNLLLILISKQAISDILKFNMTNKEKKKYGIFASKVLKNEIMQKYKHFVPKIFFILFYFFIAIYFLSIILILLFRIKDEYIRIYYYALFFILIILILLGFKFEKRDKSFITFVDFSRYSKHKKHK